MILEECDVKPSRAPGNCTDCGCYCTEKKTPQNQDHFYKFFVKQIASRAHSEKGIQIQYRGRNFINSDNKAVNEEHKMPYICGEFSFNYKII